jgi:2-polyprenyl-3-methyl-5-hydroxy-6-metoxy-1,4-benzoquinol methylase
MFKQEFRELVAGKKTIYIFGIGEVGIRLLDLLKEAGFEYKFLGFVLTLDDIPTNCKGYPVYRLDDIDRNADILVSVSKPYHPEVFRLLEEKGFCNAIEAHKYFSCTLSKTSDSECSVVDASDHVFTSQEKLVRDRVVTLFKSNMQAFGDDRIYQSLPLLGIEGLRPSDKRIVQYGLDAIVSPETSVLDIGANCGFFDIQLASRVKKILGIEVNEQLVELGKTVIEGLDIHNVSLVCSDYNSWYTVNNDKYDVILSFSVHLWLNILPEEYAKQLVSLMNKGGYIVFESHKVPTDKMYGPFLEAFTQQGMCKIRDGKIKDDGIREREFAIFRKA